MRETAPMGLAPDEEREWAVLSTVAQQTRPAGSGTIMGALARAGWLLSEATVGRELRALDELGLLAKVGRQGRRLTPSGHERLRDLTARRQHLRHGNELVNVLHACGPDEIREVLTARRAIEGETAGLAATQATEADLQQVRVVLARARENLAAGTYGPEDDMDFHAAVADAAHNRILAAALRLVRQTEGMFRAFLEVRQLAGSRLLVDHEDIYTAIADREPALARVRMVAHLDRIQADLDQVLQNGGDARD